MKQKEIEEEEEKERRRRYFQALASGFFSAVCIVISGPFWVGNWQDWWGWWLELPIWNYPIDGSLYPTMKPYESS